MKKIMIAFAVALCAVVVNAASVNWNSGTLRPALNAAGGWAAKGGVKANLADGAELMASLFLVDEATFNAASAMSSQELYAAYTGQSATASGSVVQNNIGLTTTGAEVGQSYYAVLLYSYTDKTYGEMILATTAKIDGSLITNPANTYDVMNIGSAAGAAPGGGWSAVPEPTGAMLLALGVAALALRRRRR